VFPSRGLNDSRSCCVIETLPAEILTQKAAFGLVEHWWHCLSHDTDMERMMNVWNLSTHGLYIKNWSSYINPKFNIKSCLKTCSNEPVTSTCDNQCCYFLKYQPGIFCSAGKRAVTLIKFTVAERRKFSNAD